MLIRQIEFNDWITIGFWFSFSYLDYSHLIWYFGRYKLCTEVLLAKVQAMYLNLSRIPIWGKKYPWIEFNEVINSLNICSENSILLQRMKSYSKCRNFNAFNACLFQITKKKNMHKSHLNVKNHCLQIKRTRSIIKFKLKLHSSFIGIAKRIAV